MNSNYNRGFSTMPTMNSTNMTTSPAGSGEDADANYYRWNFAFSVILAAILSISAFLAVVGNSMVLTVVIRHRGMRTRTNLFLVNLAVADLLVGAAVMPFAITTLIEGRWIFGSYNGTFCTINGWLNCFCLVASIHTLMYISVHKHYSITQPLASHFKLRQILGMMAAAWVWAAVSSTITVTGLSSVRYKMGTTQCGPEYPHGLKSYIFHAIIQVTNIFIPVIILTYCYTRMFRAIRAHSKRLQQNSTLEQDIILAQQKKVTITLFIVLAVFIICALPFHLYATYTTIQKDKHFSPYLNPVAYGSLYLNSALNPIIYAFRSPSFREGYKEILCQTPTYVISDGRRSPARVDASLTCSDLTLVPVSSASTGASGRTAANAVRSPLSAPTGPAPRAGDLAAEELQSPMRRRFSSFFSSLRRTSTASTKDYRSSCASLNSVGSQGGSPSSLVTSPTSLFGGSKRQKGIAGLIRASRRSTKQSSIIRQNGDVIIVKGGKIVSIRRQPGAGIQDSSPLIQRSLPANTGNGVGAAASNGHLAGESGAFPAVPDNNNTTTLSKPALPDRCNSLISVGSDNVFDDSSSNVVAPLEPVESPLPERISEERRLLSQQRDMEEVETDLDLKEIVKEPSPTAAAEHPAEEDSGADSKRLKTDVGIIISIDEDNSILNVMPLTPRTRDRITRSDLFLNEDKKRPSLAAPKKTKLSKSTQNLSKRSLHRLPSVEHLDPPVALKRSSSDYNVNTALKSGLFLQAAPVGRRWSTARKPGGEQV